MSCRFCEAVRKGLGIGGWRRPKPQQPPPYDGRNGNGYQPLPSDNPPSKPPGQE